MKGRDFRRIAGALSMLAVLLFTPGASSAAAPEWEAPPEGAAEMFSQGDRLFAVGAASGGAGTGVAEPDEGEQLRPSPGGETYSHSRCAMQSGGCSGVCVSHLNYYCSTSSCSSFDFC
jgi:hypothetical protein